MIIFDKDYVIIVYKNDSSSTIKKQPESVSIN